ncbi:MAG: tRNA pseudouridine(55) synthase TruB [Chloroflexi bacterium]|nr:MAG: tRNA pseudouridine(55) synthase TruB [Chloroflexota bacterium]TME46376.1 MAG: tRNA pseudouridine(55) synthase TruB [Chloroflexota bacterium]
MASGILNVNKPAGPTSFSIVRSVKRLPGARKVGHGGTLDPAADGVLPILVNGATRVAEFVHEWSKTYLAGVTFGVVSDTDDREGTLTPAGDRRSLTGERIQALLPAFTGRIAQIPPAYSALKRAGEPLYRKARRGEQVDLEARLVEIDAIELRDYAAATATARLEVRCQRGTYMRSLARDLGAALGCGAYLSSLTRLSVGPLQLQGAISTQDLVELGEGWTDALLPVDLPLRGWPAMTLDIREVETVRHGMPLAAPPSATGRYRLLDAEGRLVALAEVDAGRLLPRTVLEP